MSLRLRRVIVGAGKSSGTMLDCLSTASAKRGVEGASGDKGKRGAVGFTFISLFFLSPLTREPNLSWNPKYLVKSLFQLSLMFL